MQSIQAARLPIVGGDEDVWGTILIDWLNVSLDENGTLRSDTVNGSIIVDGAVGSDDINTNAVNASHIANGSIDIASKILDGIITGIKIAAGNITSDLIAFGAINTSHLENSAVSDAKIAGDAVNSSHIQDGSITGDDIDANTNVTVGSLNATTVFLGIEEVTATCSTASCVATANCPAGKMVISGFASDASVLCNSAPLNCNEYCSVGVTSCSVTASIASASVRIVCAKVE